MPYRSRPTDGRRRGRRCAVGPRPRARERGRLLSKVNLCGIRRAPGVSNRRRASSIVSRISSSRGSLPITSATSRLAGSGNSVSPRPAGDEGHPVLHAVDGEHTLHDFGDIAGFDGVDVAGAGSGRGDGEDTAPSADVEHDVVRAHCRSDCSQIVAGPNARRGASARASTGSAQPLAGAQPRSGETKTHFWIERVEDAEHRRQVGGVSVLTLEMIDRVAQPRWLREDRQDAEPPRPDVDDRPHGCVHDDVSRRVE